MAQYKNQHFIPQKLIKNFSLQSSLVGMLLKRNGKVLHDIDVSNQCSEDYFYGEQDIEKNVTRAENCFNKIWDVLAKVSNDIQFQELSKDTALLHLYTSVMFQRLRTRREAEKIKKSSMELVLTYLKTKVVSDDSVDSELKKAIYKLRESNLSIGKKLRFFLAIRIDGLPFHALAISDLGYKILNNKTSIPFVIGDSPVVFYNMYHPAGDIGLLVPGLMIFFPLSSHTTLFLFDKKTYDMSTESGVVCLDEHDVNELNKLQLYNAGEAVYFDNANDGTFIKTCWEQEKAFLKEEKSGFEIRDVDKDNVGLFLREQTISYQLNLSFITSHPFNASVHVRSEELEKLITHCRENNDKLMAFRLLIFYHIVNNKMASPEEALSFLKDIT